jgi:hypothetical protein
MGKGEIHYIEVPADSVDSEEEEQDSGSTSSEEVSAPAEEKPPRRPPTLIGAHDRSPSSSNPTIARAG